MGYKQEIKNYIKGNKYILRWAVCSFSFIFIVAFFIYIGNDAKNGIYPEKEFGTLKNLQTELNPYLNLYNIKEEKSDNSKYTNKIEQIGFGFISTDNSKEGSLVVKVYPDSPSDKSGLRAGDVIVNVDGVLILNDIQMGKLVDIKDKVNLKINRENQILDIYMSKGSFIGEEGFKVGTSEFIPRSKDVSDEKVLVQVNYGLNKLKNGLMEYSVEGISFLGALIISLIWAFTILPVLILGILFYKLLSKIHHKIFNILISLIFITVIMSGIMFILSKNSFFDQMVRESVNTGGGFFIDLSILLYPIFVIISSLFLIIGYNITLFIYKNKLDIK